ncbi:PocR ligand-binding domain-containing protein [Sporomusa acidovorans]|uniref:HTH-type transcriptional activator RhaR n=1 Tax=Sporomusa acidovorans (strain ATCC 49682 / DSM 3132 / Mol) TaxID=1123286 RepID=A0ABZ3J7A2_SPOA4|nr:PocR ligand-binding domain-containing protein [Sporomusa acidovorans]OZC21216.1 HTH-type transcriptional activator Btr [Sporomusa acidovorans DSM 3132]SDE65069.1 transcriptional regulator, AraC family [Sporomusa acidovorans]
MNMENDLFDIKYLEEILGSFSQATGLHIEAVDDKGETFCIPEKAERCEFCQYIRSQPYGTEKCRASYRQASLEAAKWEEPYFFRCHAGLVIWAVPISVPAASLKSIICGQVSMWRPDRFFYQELKSRNSSIKNFDELKEKAKLLEVVSPKRSQAAADMLFVVVNYLVKRDIRVLEQVNNRRMQQKISKYLAEQKQQRPQEQYNYSTYLKTERSFLRYIRLGDKIKAEKILQSLLACLFTKTVGDIKTIKIRICELAALVSRAAVEGGADAEQAMSILKNFYNQIDNPKRVEELFCLINTLILELLDNSLALANKKHLSLVNEAKKFIMSNHSKSIKIEDVAGRLFISPSYLSRLFQQEVRCTVNDYITRVRIEHAVELIKKHELSVEQVSKAIGFQSQSYFTKIFRKYIGVTPLVYRNSLL